MWENHKSIWFPPPTSLALLLSLFLPFLLLLSSQSHRRTGSNLSGAANVPKTQRRKLSLANITQQGRKTSRCRLLFRKRPEQRLHTDNEGPTPRAAGQAQAAKQMLFAGSSQGCFLDRLPAASFTAHAPVSFRQKNEENSTPHCKVCWAFFFPGVVLGYWAWEPLAI